MIDRGRLKINRRRLLTLGASALLGGVGIHLLRASRRNNPAAVRLRAKTLSARHGVVIGYGDPGTFYVPPYTVKDARIANLTATAAEIEPLAPALDGIEESLNAYPSGFIKKLCGAIFICGSLTVDRAQAGGTYGRAWIILVAGKHLSDEVNRETARLGVHHEFSSLVWTHIPTLQQRWADLLPSGWTPAKDNAEALKAPDRGFIDPQTGFLSPYASTDSENDFNTYAEKAFTAAQYVITLATAYPAIARKVALLMAAYAQIDGRISEVFDRLGLGQFRGALGGPLEEGIAVPQVQIPTPTIMRP